MVVALLNAVLAYFGLPLVHGVLPHSPLHVRAMADVEDRVSQGHVYLRSVSFRRENIDFRRQNNLKCSMLGPWIFPLLACVGNLVGLRVNVQCQMFICLPAFATW